MKLEVNASFKNGNFNHQLKSHNILTLIQEPNNYSWMFVQFTWASEELKFRNRDVYNMSFDL